MGLLDCFHHLENKCKLLYSHCVSSGLVVLVLCLDPVSDGGERSCEIHIKMPRSPLLLENSCVSGAVQVVRDFVDGGCCCRYNLVPLWV